ncbi:hypothetical protein SAMD00019534_060870 [Acytostelium subglobosum LB1]|uniref:hypothetical protein n=1 Tax=Acytostelium subglobosum LB1 TaxID=1410327 RepID=UPI000644F101|nr:hypothetical protein SAMD00019534_060870 [Acytostelium subglobosum LB1]GAM22912.1 hypothetical protein SAMD00019534_060870 [Acytostelium subglobosum LB1]|eukprot:XP_012754139.1 hypothetical protein SAMD00019534_060870 [Acytostelium subglobosum LB1]
MALLLLIVQVHADSDKEFNIKPEGKETVELVDGDMKCSFSYECSGGSSESWSMSIIKEDKNHYICMFGRPNPPSYILFKDFTITFSKGSKHFTTVEMMDNRGAILINDQYKLANNQVVPAKNFGGQLALVTLNIRT